MNLQVRDLTFAQERSERAQCEDNLATGERLQGISTKVGGVGYIPYHNYSEGNGAATADGRPDDVQGSLQSSNPQAIQRRCHQRDSCICLCSAGCTQADQHQEDE